MNMSKSVQLIFLIIFSLLATSCVEEYEFQSEVENFESILVVEATITNQDKFQEIKLSRSYNLDTIAPFPERNAVVKVISDAQGTISFSEASEGLYISNTPFTAQPNTTYVLDIQTNDGRSYTSSTEQLTTSTQIDNLYAERGFTDDNQEGMFIYVDSHDPSSSSNYYRYEYEETFKVVAPKYSPFEIVFEPGSFFDYTIELRPEQQETCYRTQLSSSIILANTTSLGEDKVEKFPSRFINRNEYIISHRYSILLRQYVISREAYVFYDVLKRTTEQDGSLLTDTQPGFIEGNVFSTVNSNEKVLGYFQVSSVDEKRIFFDYEDYFPGEDLPPYIVGCGLLSPALAGNALGNDIPSHPLYDHIQEGYQFFHTNDGTIDVFPSEGPEILVNPECGDCTELGQNTPPVFWED